MRIYTLAMVCAGVTAGIVFAQPSGRMETDRPDQAECANVVKSGYLQTELGFNLNRYGSEREWDVPTSLIKLGIGDKIELRYISVLEAADGRTSYEPDAAGVKVFLFKGQNWIPKAAVIGQYHFNDDKRDNSDYNREKHSVGELMFNLQNDFSEDFGIGYNIGPEFHSDGSAELIYRITPGWNLGEKGFFYAELFGRKAKAASEVWADAGLARYLDEDLKVDLSAGVNLQGQRKYYAALGVSWRLRLFKSRQQKP